MNEIDINIADINIADINIANVRSRGYARRNSALPSTTGNDQISDRNETTAAILTSVRSFSQFF